MNRKVTTAMATGMRKKKAELIAIHRHWYWADRIRDEYFEHLRGDPPQNTDLVAFFATGHGMYLCLWFGLEFAVCEALHAKKISIPGAEKEIKKIYSSLKLFRNAVFHIQPEYLSPKFFQLLNDPTHQTTIDTAHKAIGSWLGSEIGI
jgi:hypothetical protein